MTHINGIIYVTFSVSLVSLDMVLRFIHIVVCISNHFFLWLNMPFMGIQLGVFPSSVGGHLDCFYLLTLLSSAAMSIYI